MARRQTDWRRIEVVDDAVAEILRKKTPAERIAIGFELNTFARQVIHGGLKTQHPDWSEEQINREVARRMSGDAG